MLYIDELAGAQRSAVVRCADSDFLLNVQKSLVSQSRRHRWSQSNFIIEQTRKSLCSNSKPFLRNR